MPGYVTDDELLTNRVWCGDQGLILGGMVEYLHQLKATQEALQALKQPQELPVWEKSLLSLLPGYIKQIVAGTLDENGPLVKPASGPSTGRLQPFSPASDADSWYGHLFRDPDYWSGAAIFWRYLFQTFRTNGDVQRAVLDLLNSEDNAIYHSAETAAGPWKPEGPPYNPWSNEPWKDGPVFEWFNVLATLTVAIEVMETHQSVVLTD